MKNAPLYTRRIRKLIAQLKKEGAKPAPTSAAPTEPPDATRVDHVHWSWLGLDFIFRIMCHVWSPVIAIVCCIIAAVQYSTGVRRFYGQWHVPHQWEVLTWQTASM